MPVRDLMLVDLDAFFVSVEQRKNPALLGRPVIVGGVPGERGVVCSASYEARGYGVRAAMPLSQAAELCPKAVFLHGDYPAYAAASAEVMTLLRAFAPKVEPMSLDEAYLDLTGCERMYLCSGAASPRRGDAALAGGPAIRGGGCGSAAGTTAGIARPAARSWLDVATGFRDEILRTTGLSVSIGIGGTKAVASVATALAKPAGALEVPRGEEAAFLSALPVEFLPGVGPRTREALARFNLHTIGDLARIPEDLLEATFGRVGTALSRRARGLESLEDDPLRGVDGPVADGQPQPKSISREISFDEDTADRAVIGGTLSHLGQRATGSLRRERMLCRTVGVRLRYADFKTVEARRRLDASTDQDAEVLRVVADLWPKRWDRRVRLRLVGVTLFDLQPVGERQLGLFDSASPATTGALDKAVDRLRSRHGFGVLRRANETALSR